MEPDQRAAFLNPYITGLPVEDPAMFFGRQDVFRFIRDSLQARQQKNIIVLRGQRRTGKTSVLKQLKNQLDEKYLPVFLDLQGFPGAGVGRFFYWVSREIARAARARGYPVSDPRREQFATEPYEYFREVFLGNVLEAIGYHHILLTFDEFEELMARVDDGRLDRDLLPYLRHLMQHSDRLDFIFAGTDKIQQFTSEYWSILFNIALFKDIGFLGWEEVNQTIRQPVKGVIFYDDLAVEKIVRITAGHPYFVQLLGRKLVDAYLENGKFYLTLQDVNQVLDGVLTAGQLQFDYLWSQSTLIEQLILAALARTISREGGVAALADVTRLIERFDLKVDQISILAAIKSLVNRQLIVTDPDLRQYEFKIDLVRLWLEREQRFGVVAEAFRERMAVSPEAR